MAKDKGVVIAEWAWARHNWPAVNGGFWFWRYRGKECGCSSCEFILEYLCESMKSKPSKAEMVVILMERSGEARQLAGI